MRHIWSLIAGLVAAPLTWLLLATGQASSTALIAGWVAAGRGWDTHDLIEPAAFLLVAAVLLGILATLRISPLGPLVAGLLLLSGYVATFVDPLATRDAIPNDWVILDRAMPLHVPLDNGTLAVLGVLLLVAPFSVQRWRKWPVMATPGAPNPDPAGEPDRGPEAGEATDVSESNEITQELTPVSPAISWPAPTAPPAAPAPASRPKSSGPLTAASVAVPGPVVESPAARRTGAPAAPPTPPSPRVGRPKPQLAPVAQSAPAAQSGAAKQAEAAPEVASAPPPAPGPQPGPAGPQPGPAPTDPDWPAPEEPTVPAARRPESPWAQPPTGPGNKTKTPG